MLDVRRLRVLKEVAERGSFSAAADALNFTQSAVSQQIAALKKETGTTLLQRGSGGVRLTDAGRALVAHADVIMARLADAERELAAIAGLKGGRVRLASFPSAGATLVTEAVSLYRQRYPEVELSLTEGEPHETVPRLKRGDFDVAVVFEDSNSPGSELLTALDCVHLLDDPLCVVLPSAHSLAARKAVRLADLAGEPWVAGCGGGVCSDMLIDACARESFTPNVAFESDDHNVLVGLVSTGVGVALLPQLCLRTPPPGVEIRPVSGSQPLRHIHAAVPTDAYRSPATEAMIEVLSTVSGRFAADARPAAA